MDNKPIELAERIIDIQDGAVVILRDNGHELRIEYYDFQSRHANIDTVGYGENHSRFKTREQLITALQSISITELSEFFTKEP